MTEIAIFAGALVVQYALVFGWSYVMYRFLMKKSSDLRGIRNRSRFFGIFAAVFVFLVLLMLQLVKGDSWAWPFIAPFWIVTIFAVHDLVLGLVIKQRGD